MKYEIKYKIRNKNKKGFIALISAIIIASMLLSLTITVSTASIFGRLNLLDSESKERSANLAEACVNQAILEISQGIYPQNKTIFVGPNTEDTCTIIKTSQNELLLEQSLIKAQSAINHAYSNLLFVVDGNYSIISWKECTNFSNSLDSC